MDVLGAANQVELNLLRTQTDEQKQVSALASGLRVNSASDDPAGLAIAETIQTKVNGLQQGVQNAQEATNLLNVADGTLSTVQDILVRVRTLTVEAASDLNSSQELQEIQREINQLLQEVDKISAGAKFNGLTLLDGSLSDAPAQQGYFKIVNPNLNADGSIPSQDVADSQSPGVAKPGPLFYQDPVFPMFDTNSGYVSGYTEMKVVSYSNDPTPPGGSALGQPGVVVEFIQYSTNPNFNGTGGAQEQISYGAYAVGQGATPGGSFNINNANGSAPMLTPDIANLSPQDVGVSMAVETFDGAPAGTGSPMTVNMGGNEGDVVSMSLPNVSTTALDISDISVLQPVYVDANNNLVGTGSNVNAVDDAEARLDNALDRISGVRAQVGAQTVAMQEQANDSSSQMVNQIASESAIRDTDVAQTTTAFTKDQVLSQVAMSVISQLRVDAMQVISLMQNSFSSTPPAGRTASP